MKRTCPICQTLFEPHTAHQEYDRISCRKRAERHRARLRDKGMGIQTKGNGFGASHATIMNPTVGDLDELAKIYTNNIRALPTHCFGAIPEWTPPEGIIFGLQYGTDFWMMCSERIHEPMTILEQVLPASNSRVFDIESDLK